MRQQRSLSAPRGLPTCGFGWDQELSLLSTGRSASPSLSGFLGPVDKRCRPLDCRQEETTDGGYIRLQLLSWKCCSNDCAWPHFKFSIGCQRWPGEPRNCLLVPWLSHMGLKVQSLGKSWIVAPVQVNQVQLTSS